MVEESNELVHAESRQDRLEEAADVYEVLRALVQLDGYTMGEVQVTADQKRAVRGGFEDKLPDCCRWARQCTPTIAEPTAADSLSRPTPKGTSSALNATSLPRDQARVSSS
jgi:hypothetical protein